MKSPTEKQINLVKDITNVLNIDFPSQSSEFSRQTYFNFIKDHISEYHMATNHCDDDLFDLFYDSYCKDIWCEYY